MATIVPRPTRTSLRSERSFYLGMTATLALLVGWGFSHSFYLRAWVEPPASFLDQPSWGRWLFMVHGLVLTAWLLLFAAQTGLVGSKRLPLHKRVGKASFRCSLPS